MEDGKNISSGIGQGSAQIFKPFDYSYLDRQEAYRQKEAQARAERGQKNLSDLSKQLQSLNKLDIFHRDQPIFKQKNKETWDFANKNIRAIYEGDTGAKLQLDQMVSDLENESALSKNAREAYEQANIQLATSGKASKLRDESRAYIDNFAAPEQAGNYGFDPTQIKFHYDYAKERDSDFRAEAKAKADKGTVDTVPDPVTGLTKTVKTNSFSLPEAQQMVRTGYASDPQALEQANYVLTKNPDIAAKYKNSENPPLEYLVDTEAPKYTIKGNDYTYKHVGGPNDFGFRIGDGMAETKDWRFSGETKEEANPAYEALSPGAKKMFKGAKTVTVETIKAKSTKEGENKEYNIEDPSDATQTFKGTLDSFKKYPNGKIRFVFVKPGLVKGLPDEYVSLPAEKVSNEVKNDIGYDPHKIFATGITKGKGATIEKGKVPEGKIKVKNAKGETGYMSQAAYEAHKDKYTIVK